MTKLDIHKGLSLNVTKHKTHFFVESTLLSSFCVELCYKSVQNLIFCDDAKWMSGK